MRYLTTSETAGGFRYYWTPPTAIRGKAAWIKSTPLGSDLPTAITSAEKLNARLDQWRGKATTSAGMVDLVKSYIAGPEYGKLAPRTRKDYFAHLDAIRDDFAGSDPLDVTKPVVWAYRDGLLRQGLSERQVRYRLQVLSILFSWGSKRIEGLANPAAKMGVSSRRKTEARIWTLDQINAAMDMPYPVGFAAALALFTAQRQGDIIGQMVWPDLGEEVINLRQGKTGRRLLIPVHPRLMEAMAEAAKDRLDICGTPILLNQRGEPYTESGFRSVWAKRIPRDWPTFHEIRATATTWLSAAGLSDDEITLWTGHGRGGKNAILDVYDRRLRDMRERVFPIMDGWRKSPNCENDRAGNP